MYAEKTSQVELTGVGPKPEHRPCSRCGTARVFRPVMWYRALFIGGPFGVIAERKYLFLCSICNTGWELDKKKVKIPLHQIPLPFLYKYGLIIGLVIVFLVLVYQGITRLYG
jgi:hypothetical protein